MTDDLHGLGAIQSPFDPRDFPLDALYAITGQEKAIVIPDTFIAPSEVYAPLDQGSTPQCVAFSSGAMKVCEDGPWPLDTGLFFARIGGGPGGAIVRYAFAQMLKVGYPPDEANHKILGYYSVPMVKAEIQAAIMAFGPIVFGLTWYNSWFSPHGGVLPTPDFAAGGHAILAIGWDARGLRFRNSWGTRWGLSGDCFLPWSMLSAAWEAWKAVDVPNPPPTPDPTPTPESTMQYLTPYPRIFDGPVAANTVVTLQVAGVGAIPATAVAVSLIVRVDRATSTGWVYAGPDPSPLIFGKDPKAGGVPSTLDYNAGLIEDGFPSVALKDGKLTIWSTQALPRLVIDLTGFAV